MQAWLSMLGSAGFDMITNYLFGSSKVEGSSDVVHMVSFLL